MVKVTWTVEAVRWLEEIYERSRVLVDFPEIGYRYQASLRHIRFLLYGHYRIAYLVKDTDSIDILGVFHGALDIDRYSL